MSQRDLTIVAPIRTRRDVVERRLDALGDLERAGKSPFEDFADLHFLAAFVIDGSACGPASVVLELNFDGRRREFLERLVRSHSNVLAKIFGHCEGYPDASSAGSEDVVDFLWKRRMRAGTFYVGHPGRSVKRIAEERELRERARSEVERNGFVTRRHLWAALKTLEPNQPFEPLPLRVRLSTRGGRGPRRVAAAARLLARGLLRLTGAVAFVALARWAWEADPGYRRWVVVLPLALPALVGLAVWRERPRHLTLRGKGPVVRAAARRGLGWALRVAVGVGLVAVVASPWWAPWASSLPLEALSGSLRLLAGALVALAAAVLGVGAGVLAFILLGRIAGLTVGVAAGTAALAGSGAGSLFLGQPFETGRLLGYLGAAAAGTLLVALGTGAYLLELRRRERRDAVGGIRWDNAHLEEMTRHEDRQLQNHFASVTEIKDPMRLYQLRVVLRLSSLLVRLHFNQGDLAGIPSIHFARFIILPDRRLLFATHYDAGWANYLGEFTHVPGVTAVWGSTRLFPRPFLIFGDGARDEQRFKSRARRSQVKTRLWHSAYPPLAVSDINRNTRLREDLARELPDERQRPSRGWFADARRLWRRPLDDAGLDEAIRGL